MKTRKPDDVAIQRMQMTCRGQGGRLLLLAVKKWGTALPQQRTKHVEQLLSDTDKGNTRLALREGTHRR
jgi:hypothetical protein